jgi:hypothetical protein
MSIVEQAEEYIRLADLDLADLIEWHYTNV